MSWKKTRNYIFKKLHQSGWQSWSNAVSKAAKFPLFNYLPKNKKHHFPKLKNFLSVLKKPTYGWCSWYAFGESISEKKILEQAKHLLRLNSDHNLSLDYVLVDGGWSAWGDWQKPNKTKFPRGIKNTSKEIKKLGLKPGIWMAPFLVDPRSEIATKHPDWLVRHKGKLVDGFKLTGIDGLLPHRKWILNIKNTAVKKYLSDSVKYLVETCGYELLKLDFLYGIYFDPNISNIEANKFLRGFLKSIKRKYRNVYTIACGCPLIPAVGVVDSMRIGPDTTVAPFTRLLALPIFSRWHLDKNVIPTLVNRLWTKKLWNVDPDAFVCHHTSGFRHGQLNKFQKLISKAKGNIFLGDDLGKLTEEKIKKYIKPLFN